MNKEELIATGKKNIENFNFIANSIEEKYPELAWFMRRVNYFQEEINRVCGEMTEEELNDESKKDEYPFDKETEAEMRAIGWAIELGLAYINLDE